MTLQTPEPLRRRHLTPYNFTVSHFVGLRNAGRLELDAPYQRGHVWGPDRRRNLIRSVLLGVPFGSIVVNDRSRASDYADVTRAVIDGKQRVTTLLMWLDGELTVPASWFDPAEVREVAEWGGDGPYVTAYGLSSSLHASFDMLSVPTLEATLGTLAEEQEIFDLINFGGVPQGSSDVSPAPRYSAEVLDDVRRVLWDSLSDDADRLTDAAVSTIIDRSGRAEDVRAMDAGSTDVREALLHGLARELLNRDWPSYPAEQLTGKQWEDFERLVAQRAQERGWLHDKPKGS